jgi:hypothetical protein
VFQNATLRDPYIVVNTLIHLPAEYKVFLIVAIQYELALQTWLNNQQLLQHHC